jgi:hypothetical protein
MYFPKNKILESQYTAGNQFIVKSTGKEYVGYYYVLSNGKTFTGKNNQYKPSFELIKFKGLSKDDIKDPAILEYTKLKQGTKIEKILTYNIIPTFYPKPTEEEYATGIITRYFAKPVNANAKTIKEIKKDVYESIFHQKGEYDDALNIVTKVPWQITGPLHDVYQGEIIISPGIIDTNFKQIKIAEIRFPGLSSYLIDLKEFSK